MWERFSYYGMWALLVLDSTKYVLLPAQAGNVVGLAGFKSVLETGFGPLEVQPLASQIYGIDTALPPHRVDLRRAVCRPAARATPHGHHRRDADGGRPFPDGGGRTAVFRSRRSRSSWAMALSSRISRPRSAFSIRPGTIAATAPIRSFMSASISVRSWRRSFAARWARKPAGITDLQPPASAC